MRKGLCFCDIAMYVCRSELIIGARLYFLVFQNVRAIPFTLTLTQFNSFFCQLNTERSVTDEMEEAVTAGRFNPDSQTTAEQLSAAAEVSYSFYIRMERNLGLLLYTHICL